MIATYSMVNKDTILHYPRIEVIFYLRKCIDIGLKLGYKIFHF